MSSIQDLARFVLWLRDRYGLSTFVETGTYLGSSTAWAAERFAKVESIELEIAHLRRARTALSGCANVTLYNGDSRDVLPLILAPLDRPALLWLDAHHVDNMFADRPDDCPVMDELRSVFASGHRHFVLVDDASGFGFWTEFPTLAEVGALASAAGYVQGVAHDVLAVMPDVESLERCLRSRGPGIAANPVVVHGGG